MAMGMLPPQPPRSLVPRPLLEGPVVQISDIRKEPGRLTESEAREELSDFVIYRFERADQATDYDSEGERVTPTWANVVRTEVRGISKKEAARQVRMLHDIHKPLSEKKATLTDAQQRQLEKVLEGLEMNERDPRYHYVLVQIDRKLRDKKVRDGSRDRVEIRRHGDRKHGEKHGRRYSENRGRRETVEFVDLHGRRRSTVRDPRKKVQETVSITAYYKRCPKPDVDAIAMVLQREAENARQLEPPHPHHTFAPHQMQHNQMAMQGHHPQANGNMAMAMGMGMPMGTGMGPQQGNKPMGAGNPNMKTGNNYPNNMKNGNNPQIKVLANKPNGNNVPRKKSPAPHQRRQPRSPTSSRDSMYSESGSDSESNSVLTPNSSHSSYTHSHNNKRRLSSPTKQRRGSRFIEEPTHFGIPPRTVDPHKQRRHEEHRITDEMFPVRRSLPPLAPAPPAPPRLSVDLDEIEANAYAAGRADERGALRDRAEVLRPLPRLVQHPRRSLTADAVLLEDEPGLLLPPSPPLGGRLPLRPRVLQHRPSVRLVRPGDVALDEEVLDTLERFRLEDDGIRGRYRDEGRSADDYYDDVILRSERRRIEEARLRDEEIAIDRERERVERARAYLRRADSEGDVLYERDGVDPLNPFAPRPGITRRATVGYGMRAHEYL